MTNEQMRRRIAELEEGLRPFAGLVHKADADSIVCVRNGGEASELLPVNLEHVVRAVSLLAASPASEPTEDQKKAAFDAEMSKPLTSLENVVVGLSLLEHAIREGDPAKELALRTSDILQEVQEAREEYELNTPASTPASDPDADVVERVAQSIWERQGYCKDDLDDPFQRLSWEELKEVEADYAPTVTHTMDLARAALSAYLKAMEEAGFVMVPKEPTEAMVEAADERMRAWIPMPTYKGEYGSVLRDAYRAMIAARDADGRRG